MPKGRRERGSVDDDLDVIDFLTDERRSTALEPELERDNDDQPHRRRRRLVLATAAAVVAIAGLLVAESRDDGETEGVGIASEEPVAQSGRGSRDASDAPPRTEPDVVPAAWGALGARFALGYERDLLIVDGANGTVRHPRTLPDGTVRVVHGHGGAVFIVAGEARLLLDDGRITDVEGTRAFPGIEADLWWGSRTARVAPIIGDAPVALMPENTYAFAAVRGGFVVQDDRSGAVFLIVDGALRLIADQSRFSVVAIHPDRIAWHGGCPGSACVLHVTEVATGHDVVIPGPVPLFEPNRAIHGRFSPDARYLALQPTAVQGERSDFVLVDLMSGATLTRLEIDRPMPATVSTGVTAVPFDFTPDSQHLIVADWSTNGGRLVVLRTADGVQEQIVERTGQVSSLAALDAQPYEPTTPLVPDHPPPGARTGEPGTTTYTFGGPFESDFIDSGRAQSCLVSGTYDARLIPVSTTAQAVGQANITYQVCVEPMPSSSSYHLSGTFLLTTNDGTAAGTFVGSAEDPVIGATVHYDMTITTGTGPFAGATGTGTLDSTLVDLPFHFNGTVAGAFDVPG